MYRFLLIIGLFAAQASVGDTHPAPALDYPTSKLWLHRANTVAKAQMGVSRYPGIEVDVIYYQGVDRFDVRHRWLAASSGLTLDALLASLEGQPRVWVDFKNANWWNSRGAAKRLVVLMQRHGVTGRVIVEARNPRALSRIAQEGVPVSWWLPAFDLTATSAQLAGHARDVRGMLAESGIGVVSAPHTYAAFLTEHLQDVPAHLWTNGLKVPRDEAQVSALETMPNVRVLLVDVRVDQPSRKVQKQGLDDASTHQPKT